MTLARFNQILMLGLVTGLVLVIAFSMQDPFAILVIGIFSLGYFGWTLALGLALYVFAYHKRRHATGLGIGMALVSFVLMLPTAGLIFMVVAALFEQAIL